MIPILLILWLACGLRAVYLAHTGIHRDCVEENGPGDYSLGGLWVIWGPFLAGLFLLGGVSLLCVTMMDRGERSPADEGET